MSKLGTKFRYMYDAAPEAALRAKGQADITASATSPEFALGKVGGYWNNAGELADQMFAVVVNVTLVDPDGTYDIELQAGPAGFATNKVVAALRGVTKPGQYVLFVDTLTLRALKSDAAAIRLNTVVTDTDGAGANVPGINFYSWIAPVQA
jgi:hypothetical protein